MVPFIITRGLPLEHNMLVRVLRAISRGDNVADPMEILAPIVWTLSRDLVRTFLCLERVDDFPEKTDEEEDGVQVGSVKNGWLGRYSIISSSKSRGGICGQLPSDIDESHLPFENSGRRNETLDIDRMKFLGRL